jgi:hypothetical protein
VFASMCSPIIMEEGRVQKIGAIQNSEVAESADFPEFW